MLRSQTARHIFSRPFIVLLKISLKLSEHVSAITQLSDFFPFSHRHLTFLLSLLLTSTWKSFLFWKESLDMLLLILCFSQHRLVIVVMTSSACERCQRVTPTHDPSWTETPELSEPILGYDRSRDNGVTTPQPSSKIMTGIVKPNFNPIYFLMKFWLLMICPYDILLSKARHFRDGDSEKF